jgi:predicted TIM-barrel fold metal-dependent hydrolase
VIDVHAHAIPDFLASALQAAGKSASLGAFPSWTPDLALATMDRFGIERSILSASAPGVHFGDDRSARVLARKFNEFCAELSSQDGRRFGAFAALPLPDVEGSCAEAVYALDVLGCDGVGLLASYDTFFLGNPKLDPLMEELNKRNAIVFVHPAGHPTSRTLPLDFPIWVIEYPIDTLRAAVSLVLSGTLSRFPNIRFILAHNGGALPFLAWRVGSVPLIDRRYAHLDEATLRAQFASFYYEIAQSPGDEALGSLLQVANPQRILFGSDWPFCREPVVERIISTFDQASLLDRNQRRAIRTENATALLVR